MAHRRYGISLVWIALALVITGCAAAVTGLPATPESAPTKVTPTEPTQPEAKAAETASRSSIVGPSYCARTTSYPSTIPSSCLPARQATPIPS